MIEVIFAISLVGLIILFLFGLIPTAGLMGREAEQQLSATEYAKELDVRMGSTAFATLKAADGKTLTPALPGFLGDNLQDRELADHTVLHPEVSLKLMPPANRLIQATITMRWQSRERQKHHTLVKRYSSVIR